MPILQSHSPVPKSKVPTVQEFNGGTLRKAEASVAQFNTNNPDELFNKLNDMKITKKQLLNTGKNFTNK